MSLTGKRIEASKQLIVEAALGLFYKNGIEETTILQVAKAAQVGVSSVYRYFGTKRAIVLNTTALLWGLVRKEVDKRFVSERYDEKTGLQQIEACVQVYVEILKSHRRFYLYVHELDQFSRREDLSADGNVQENLVFIKPYFVEAIHKGQRDGTIRSGVDPQKIYSIIAYYIIGLSHKISLFQGSNLLEGKKDALQDFDTATEILLCYLKKPTTELRNLDVQEDENR